MCCVLPCQLTFSTVDPLGDVLGILVKITYQGGVCYARYLRVVYQNPLPSSSPYFNATVFFMELFVTNAPPAYPQVIDYIIMYVY